MTPTPDLRELLAKATPGPWLIHAEYDVGYPPTIHAPNDGLHGPIEPLSGIDQQLAVEAVNALPSLLDTIARLEARKRELVEDKKNLAIELSIATGRQRVSIVDQNGNVVGHSFRSMKELTTEEAHVDDAGAVWTRPTAWAYFSVCRALAAARTLTPETDHDE